MNALLILLLAIVPARGAPAALPNSPVIFLGDSLTAGYGLSPDEAYPALVEKELRANKLPFRVVNGGSSGDTTAGGMRRLAWLLKQKPFALVVALGANDMLRGVPPTETEKNLDEIIRRAKDAGAAVALLGMKATPNLGQRFRTDFDAVYPRVAKRHSVPLLPFFIEDVAGDPKLNQADGLHPTAEGQKKVASRVAKFLIPFLEKELR